MRFQASAVALLLAGLGLFIAPGCGEQSRPGQPDRPAITGPETGGGYSTPPDGGLSLPTPAPDPQSLPGEEATRRWQQDQLRPADPPLVPAPPPPMLAPVSEPIIPPP